MDITLYLSGDKRASDLARQIGVSPVLISQWKLGVRPIPAERCIDIERATNGIVTCEELRPDLAERWAYLRSTGRVIATVSAENLPKPATVECASGDPHGAERRKDKEVA